MPHPPRIGISVTSRGSINASRGSLNASRGSIDASRGSIDASRGSIDASRGSIDATSASHWHLSQPSEACKSIRSQLFEANIYRCLRCPSSQMTSNLSLSLPTNNVLSSAALFYKLALRTTAVNGMCEWPSVTCMCS